MKADHSAGSAAVGVVAPFLPEACAGYVAELLARHPLEVRLSRPRQSKFGDHRPPRRPAAVHRITVNEDLNPYAFLTTLLHEIAHAATWERHRGRRRMRPHGPEWKEAFREILRPVVEGGLLPGSVAEALGRGLANPAAATCSDRGLVLALAAFDPPAPGRVRVEDLLEASLFRLAGGAYRAGRLLRSRRACFALATGREYRVHRLALVEPLAETAAAGRPRLGTVPGTSSRRRS